MTKKHHPLDVQSVGEDTYIVMSKGHHDLDQFISFRPAWRSCSAICSGVKAGTLIMLDTISKEFAAARDRAAEKLGLDLGASQPTFHEQRPLAARLHEEEGRDAQRLLGHRSAKMTDLYRDSRGAEWIDVA